AAGRGARGTLPFEKLGGDIVVNPPLVPLERGNVRLLGGTTDGRMRLVSAGPDAGLTAHVEAAGLDLSQLPAPRDRPRPAGKFELHAALEGPPPRAPAFRDCLHGNGRCALPERRL